MYIFWIECVQPMYICAAILLLLVVTLKMIVTSLSVHVLPFIFDNTLRFLYFNDQNIMRHMTIKLIFVCYLPDTAAPRIWFCFTLEKRALPFIFFTQQEILRKHSAISNNLIFSHILIDYSKHCSSIFNHSCTVQQTRFLHRLSPPFQKQRVD